MSEVRLIDANALRERFEEARDEDEYCAWLIRDMIDGAPTIDPVRHAHWWAPFAGCAICSACNEEQDVEMFVGNPVQKYCARCGARMDQGDGGGRDG